MTHGIVVSLADYAALPAYLEHPAHVSVANGLKDGIAELRVMDLQGGWVLPSRLFNSSLEGNTRRAIDIHEGEKVDARAFNALVKAAVVRNGRPTKKR